MGSTKGTSLWEPVELRHDNSVERFPVPGGWLYRVSDHNAAGEAPVIFVPCPTSEGERKMSIVSTGKPIRPDDIPALVKTRIPACVIDVCNELIVENWNVNQSAFELDTLVTRSVDRHFAVLYQKGQHAPPVATAAQIDEYRVALLRGNVFAEDSYREAGWLVNRHDYNDGNGMTFVFSPNPNR